MSKKPAFFSELKRRHIWRVAIAYAVTAWLLLQLAAIVLPSFGAPHWVLRVLIGLFVFCFPLALLLAWAFEITPEGVRRTESLDSNKAENPRNRRRVGQALNIAIIVILAAAVGVLAWRLTTRKSTAAHSASAATRAPASPTAIPPNSIAVLPFLDLSPEHNQGYFAEGISEQLLDILAQATNLEVAARTSAFQFKGKPENVTKIGKILRVRHVLEGSVRRDGKLVRITAQLINTRTGYHEWSHTYQRRMTDIFTVQDAISKAIADALEAQFSMSAGTKAVAKADPATNPDAYDEYLLGRHLLDQRNEQSLRKALKHFKNAIDLDPDYAPPYAQIAIVYLLLGQGPGDYGDYTYPEAEQLAQPFIARAEQLAPDAPETLGARGLYLRFEGRFDKAQSYLDKAVAANPSYMGAVTWRAQNLDQTGHPREALEAFAAGARRDPLNWLVNGYYVDNLLDWHHFDDAELIAQRFLAMNAVQGHQMLGDVASARGHYSEAVRQYLLSLQEHPGWRPATERLSTILRNAGLHKDAYKFANILPEYIAAVLAGYRSKALIGLKRLRQQKSRDVTSYIFAGYSYLILGRNTQALGSFQEAGKKTKAMGASLRQTLGISAAITLAALLKETGKDDPSRELMALARQWNDDRYARLETSGMPPNGSYAFHKASLAFFSGNDEAGFADLKTAYRVASEQHAFQYFMTPLSLEKASPQFDTVRNDPRFKAIVKIATERQAKIRAEILPVLCNWHYPADGWHPLPSTCKGVPKTSSTSH